MFVCVAATLALAGCSAQTGPQLQGAGSQPAKASATKSAPDTAAPQPLDQEVEFGGFVSPTGNVACMIAADLARCDIIDHEWSAPPRPADCEYDYGHGIAVQPGKTGYFVCAGDTTFGPDTVLAYGDSMTSGPMRCESEKSGITCRDLESGHGFSISLQAFQVF